MPTQAEGNPFYTLVEDVHQEQGEGIIKMKLDKAKILDAETKLNTLLKELLQVNNKMSEN